MKSPKYLFRPKTTSALFACALALSLIACSAINSVENEAQGLSNDAKSAVLAPAPNTAFTPDAQRETKVAYLPFQKAWIKPDFDFKTYSALVVAPVNTQYMLKMDWLHKLSSVNYLTNVKQDIQNLAIYFQNQVITDFQNDPNQRFTVLNYPAQQTQGVLQLELALIEVDPSMPMLNAAGWLEPGGGTAAGIINQRTAAFEGRIRDLSTHQIVATFADRNMQNVDPLDLTRLTWYGPAKQIIDTWAKEFVEIANRQPGEVVSAPAAFSINPF
jgi:hypothetical protein